MNRISTLVNVSALAASLVLHVAVAAILPPDAAEVQIEGGKEIGVAMLGNGFADLTQGAVPAAEPDALLAPTAPTANVPSAHPPMDPARFASANIKGLTLPTKPATAPLMPTAPHDTGLARPETATITATEPPRSMPAQKPKPRPERKATRSKPETPPARPGAETARKKGQTDGVANGASPRAAKVEATSQMQGNGAANSNYKGDVMRTIARTPKRSAGARGRAMIGLSIASNGAVARVVVVKSSGNPAIDKTAQDHIRRAGSFAPPPGGKPINLVVAFESKG